MNKRIVHTVFEKQVEKYAAKTAIEEEGRIITYLDLNNKANSLSYRLLDRNVHKGSVVAVLLPAGIELVSALLAVFKSGGIYLPVDARFPVPRLRQMFDQCKPAVLITNTSMLAQLPAEVLDLAEIQVILTDENGLTAVSGNRSRNFENPSVHIVPGDNNYIFYTSGSTGESKAILGIHDSLSHFIHWEIKEFSINEDFRISQLTQHTFDASLRDIFVALCAGGTLCIPAAETKNNIASLTEWLHHSRITLMHCVPSLFRLITRELKETSSREALFNNMKHILIAGEILFAKDIHFWRSVAGDHVELVNLYGPTETTLVKTFHRIREVARDPAQIVHVGKPISNTAIAIINDNILCTSGEIGDVYIRTPFMTAGYYKNETLTRSVFVQNPLVAHQKDIVYKTGDRGRYLPDQNIEILNRLDDQVKINGIRVELSEIHRAVLAMDGVEQSVVMARRNDEWQNELVCYYSGKNIPVSEMRNGLGRELNENIIPSYFIHLDVFPVNSNGKIDKGRLPDPRQALSEEAVSEISKNEREREIENIWKEILDIGTEISRNASFFHVGGNSLKAILLISRIFKRLNAKITIKDIYSHPTIGALSKLIFPEQREGPVEILPVSRQAYYDLSHSQKRLWILDQIENAGSVYNISSAWLLEGILDVRALELTFSVLIERHEILRTTFPTVEGEPKQIVHECHAWPFTMEFDDLSSCKDQETCTDVIMQEAVKIRFNLGTGPLFRMQLIKLGPQRHLVILTMHHIISDGWSMQVLFRDIVRIYKDALQGNAKNLNPLTIQYKDYCSWLNGQLTSNEVQRHKNYWMEQFSGELPVPELPADRRRPSRKSFQGDSCMLPLDKELTGRIAGACEEKGTSLFMWLVSVVYTLLYRYTDQKDIIIGTVVAGREHADLEDQVGFYVNTLPLRMKIGGNEPFDSLLQKVKNTSLDAFAHQLYPFDLLLDELSLARDLSQSPLFEVMVVLQNVHLAGDNIKDPEGINISLFPFKNELSKFDLIFNFNEGEEGLLLKIDYNKDLFLRNKIERLTAHFENLTRAFVENSSLALNKANLLSSGEIGKILHEFNDTDSDYPVGTTVIASFEQQVKKSPANMAVFYGNKGMSYDELNKYSNQLANFLTTNFHIGKGDLVSVMVDRSDSLLIAILGTLKCGSAYLPIDKNYPGERILQILEDSCSKILITDIAQIETRTPAGMGIFYFQDTRTFAGYPEQNPPQSMDANDLAYVIYTSGSTGKPKGVMVENKALVNLCHWHISSFGLNEVSKATLYAGIGFDASVWETWPYLLSGGCLFPLKESVRLDMPRLIDFLNEHKITHTFLPTLICEQLIEYPDLSLFTGLTILTGGDRLRKHTGSKDLNIVNNYGPTEAAVVSTSIPLKNKEYETIPIGKPIANTNVLILDTNLNIMPVGLAGEIFIAGDNLARGYLHHPELTDGKFIPNPFNPIKGDRLYATGDQGLWLEDGNIEFLGRKDQQVKIRGYRIELQEIENVMMGHPAIENAVVQLKETETPCLIACYTATEKVLPADIKAYLADQLPFYMLPSYYIKLDAFPVTANGKIDKDELLKLERVDRIDAPDGKDPLEKQLIEIWKEVLGRKDIGASTNFFEIGGHSLKATQVLSRIYRHFGVNIDLAGLFVHQTVRDLAILIRTTPSEPFMEIEPSEEQEYYPLSYSQKRLWLINALQENSTAYNIYSAYTFKGSLNKAAFESAIKRIIDRHEIVRTVFPIIDGVPRQKIYSSSDFFSKFEYLEYKGRHNKDRIRSLMEEALSTCFDIEKGPLFKCVFIEREVNDFLFILNVHHLILDGWSLGILFNEIITLYNTGCRRKGELSLPAPAIQYRDYVYWSENHLRSRSELARHYWLSQFQDPVIPVKLVQDFERPEKRTFNGKNIIFSINEEDTACIHDLLKSNGVTLFMFMLATIKIFLFKLSGQPDIVIGTPSAGRTHKSLENLLGFFVNTLALRTRIDGAENFLSLLANVKKTALNAFKYEYYPFEKLVDELDAGRDYRRNPLFDVFITLQNAGTEIKEDMEGLSVDPFQLDTATSQFDLSFDFWEWNTSITGKFNYAEDLFLATTAEKMLAGYLKLLKTIIHHPTDKINDISLLDPLEESLIRAWGRIRSVPVSALKPEAPFVRDTDTRIHIRLLADHLRETYGLKITPSEIFSQRNFSELMDYVRVLNRRHRESPGSAAITRQ